MTQRIAKRHPSHDPASEPVVPVVMARVAVAAVSAVLLVRLGWQAHTARLSSDECFHAYLAEWIATHGRLPDRLPELFGGLWYSYPPLLHILGAGWWSWFGAANLVMMNVLLFASLLATLAFFPVPGLQETPRRWAILACLITPWFGRFAVSFWAEMLICVLVLVTLLAWLRHHHTERMRDACIAGVGLGLALLAKQTALMMLVVPLAAAALAWRAQRGRRAFGLAVSAAIGLAIAAPMFVRNTLRFGSPIYPAFARDVDPWLYRLYRLQAGYTPTTYLTECASTIGPWIGVMALAACVVAWRRGRRDLLATWLVITLAGFGVGWLSPLHTARHVAPLVALLALVSSALIHGALASRRGFTALLEALLLVIAILTPIARPDIRGPLDLSPRLDEAFRAVAREVPAGKSVLTLWVYETYYYARRPSTWPLAWGQKVHPVELFGDVDAERFMELVRRDRIDYILLPLWRVPQEFLGSDYSAAFVDHVVTLTRERRMQVVWQSRQMALIATDPARARFIAPRETVSK